MVIAGGKDVVADGVGSRDGVSVAVGVVDVALEGVALALGVGDAPVVAVEVEAGAVVGVTGELGGGE